MGVSPCRTLSGSPRCVRRQLQGNLPAPQTHQLRRSSLESKKVLTVSCFNLLKVEEEEKLEDEYNIGKTKNH